MMKYGKLILFAEWLVKIVKFLDCGPSSLPKQMNQFLSTHGIKTYLVGPEIPLYYVPYLQ
jgi:hypothetical protein